LSPDDSYKNLDYVIRAMPDVQRRVPDAHLVIVGHGSDRRRLEAVARDAGAADIVHFAGFVAAERLPSFYQHCDVFVLPSVGEGFGIVFLEAMFFAKPCLGARATAVPEVIEHGVSGWLCDPTELDRLHAPIADLLLDSELSTRLGAAGQRRLVEHFSFDAFRARVAKWVWNT
jgi:glycosyltransferase involved in cell wall biosynthesis